MALLSWPDGTAGRMQSAGQQEPSYGLALTPLTWTVTSNDGTERKISGMVGRGIALHPTNEGADRQGSARPVRMVLMPMESAHTSQRASDAAELKYGIFVAQAASGRFEGIDLHAGAALIDLGPAAGADDPAIRASLEAGRTTRPIEGVDRRDVKVAYFPYWPLIITHSIVAGAEGTRIIAIASPERGRQNARAFFGLVDGSSASIDWEANQGGPLRLNTRDRVCVNVVGDRRLRVRPDEDQQRRVAGTLEALRAGWKAAFPEDRR
ncbi:MAG: hypothetical protein ACIAS6_06560 [Phycisphaerales bacterium JB060]